MIEWSYQFSILSMLHTFGLVAPRAWIKLSLIFKFLNDLVRSPEVQALIAKERPLKGRLWVSIFNISLTKPYAKYLSNLEVSIFFKKKTS